MIGSRAPGGREGEGGDIVRSGGDREPHTWGEGGSYKDNRSELYKYVFWLQGPFLRTDTHIAFIGIKYTFHRPGGVDLGRYRSFGSGSLTSLVRGSRACCATTAEASSGPQEAMFPSATTTALQRLCGEPGLSMRAIRVDSTCRVKGEFRDRAKIQRGSR